MNEDGTLSELAARVAELEGRVGRLEGRPVTAAGGGGLSTDAPFWALEALEERLVGDDGGVVFAGVVPLPTGERYRWQWGAAVEPLLDGDWSAPAGTLAALGHPVRLLLLRQVLTGARTVAELQAHEGLGTSGQLYHHLRQLVGAGWLRATARGQYAVPPERVIPLLVVLAAAQR